MKREPFTQALLFKSESSANSVLFYQYSSHFAEYFKLKTLRFKKQPNSSFVPVARRNNALAYYDSFEKAELSAGMVTKNHAKGIWK